jgi:hypothetical protein
VSPGHDTISELEAVTAEMAALQDLGGKRLAELLEKRGTLIERLSGSNWDAGDKRLAAIVVNAAQLQERLQRHADSIRGELSSLEMTRALLSAAKSTVAAPQAKGLDVSG